MIKKKSNFDMLAHDLTFFLNKYFFLYQIVVIFKKKIISLRILIKIEKS